MAGIIFIRLSFLALDKIKAAFFQVFENYRKKLRALKNKRDNYLKGDEGIKKKIDDCKEKFIIEKYTVNGKYLFAL